MKKPGHRSHVSGVRRMLSGKKASGIQDKLRKDAARIEWKHRELQRRRAAILAMKRGRKNHGLVPVLCEDCGGPIATTTVDRAKGEPIVLYDFPDNAKGWHHMGGDCPDAVLVDFQRHVLGLKPMPGTERLLQERIAAIIGIPAEALA